MHYPSGFAGLPAVNWRAIAAFFITLAINIYLGVAQPTYPMKVKKVAMMPWLMP